MSGEHLELVDWERVEVGDYVYDPARWQLFELLQRGVVKSLMAEMALKVTPYEQVVVRSGRQDRRYTRAESARFLYVGSERVREVLLLLEGWSVMIDTLPKTERGKSAARCEQLVAVLRHDAEAQRMVFDQLRALGPPARIEWVRSLWASAGGPHDTQAHGASGIYGVKLEWVLVVTAPDRRVAESKAHALMLRSLWDGVDLTRFVRTVAVAPLGADAVLPPGWRP